jgi:hypothetical protein
MGYSRWAVIAGGAALLASATAGLGGQAAAPVTPDRLEKTEKLIEASSAARSVKTSGDGAAEAKRAEARDLLEEARAASRAGDQEAADRLLTRATATFYEAVRMVPEDQSLVDKHYRDYDDRLRSLEALRAAYARIREEKGLGPDGAGELPALVQDRLDRAEAERRAGRPEAGRRLLDEAYVAAKVAIEQLRGGDTLVHALRFETKEEEYRYELDRNHTHRLLVDLLLADKDDPDLARAVGRLVHEAEALRRRAEREAAAGDYDKAVATLEASTRELVQAIRSAGVFIPG